MHSIRFTFVTSNAFIPFDSSINSDNVIVADFVGLSGVDMIGDVKIRKYIDESYKYNKSSNKKN